MGCDYGTCSNCRNCIAQTVGQVPVPVAAPTISLETILVNIWDDYWDDGVGKPQETYAYIEEYERLNERQKEEIAALVLAHIQTLDMTGVTVGLMGEDVSFKNLTHVRREQLVKELEAAGLTYNGIPLHFYSES